VTGLNGKPRKPTAHASVHQALRDLGIDHEERFGHLAGELAYQRAEGVEAWVNRQRSRHPTETLIEMRLVFSTSGSECDHVT